MKKEVISEISIFYGNLNLPKGLNINFSEFKEEIFQKKFFKKKLNNSKNFNIINNYVTDYAYAKFNTKLVYKKDSVFSFKPEEITKPILDVDPVDLKNSSDFTMLYAVNVKDCLVRIYYDDNRRKGRSWDIGLKNNRFIMFPSNNMYIISNNQKESINLITKIQYEYI
jgi:hypothetical protein